MRLVTWNVNSLRARLERVETWLDEVSPDIVCMQETKLSDDAFPALAFEAMGYASAHYGQGQWNGVAILSKVGLDDVVTNFASGIEPDPDARLVTATCGGIRVSCCYVPNGRAVGDPHYEYKLHWLDRLRAHLAADAAPAGDVIVTGDFNIAPEDRDVYSPELHVGATHVSQPERDRLTAICDWGLTDLFRLRHPDADDVYTWWDYRAGNFHKGLGMRIDLVLGSRTVADRCTWSVVDRNARKGTAPSDHAPVIVDLA
jgi:exodeoxyribonuclease-3